MLVMYVRSTVITRYRCLVNGRTDSNDTLGLNNGVYFIGVIKQDKDN